MNTKEQKKDSVELTVDDFATVTSQMTMSEKIAEYCTQNQEKIKHCMANFMLQKALQSLSRFQVTELC